VRQRRPELLTSDDSSRKYKDFLGLINTQAPVDFGFKGLSIANNVMGDDAKQFHTRPGFSLFRAGAPITAFVLGSEMYVVEGGVLRHLLSATESRDLLAGLTGTSYSWDVINSKAYFVNGVEAGVVFGDTYESLRVAAPSITSVEPLDVGALPATRFNVGQGYDTALWRFCATYMLSDGRESAPSEAVELIASPTTRAFRVTVPPQYARTNLYVTEPDGTVFRLATSTTTEVTSFAALRTTTELTTYGTSPLPDGVDQLVYWNGKLWVAQYFPAENTSVIWFSKSFAFHLYDMGGDYIVVPGRVAMLLWNNAGLLIGSTEAVYQYDAAGKLDTVVGYGVTPGSAGVVDSEGVAYFWTTRGLCKASPFENLTEKTVGMPAGLWANTALVYLDGMQQVVTITQGGGTPFNVRS
jgi:hypothetical protein